MWSGGPAQWVKKTGLHREGGGIGLPTLPVGAGGSVHVIFQLSYEEPLLFKPNWGHQGQPRELCGGGYQKNDLEYGGTWREPDFTGGLGHSMGIILTLQAGPGPPRS